MGQYEKSLECSAESLAAGQSLPAGRSWLLVDSAASYITQRHRQPELPLCIRHPERAGRQAGRQTDGRAGRQTDRVTEKALKCSAVTLADEDFGLVHSVSVFLWQLIIGVFTVVGWSCSASSTVS